MKHVLVLLIGLQILPTLQARYFSEGGVHGININELNWPKNDGLDELQLERVVNKLRNLEYPKEDDIQYDLSNKAYPETDVDLILPEESFGQQQPEVREQENAKDEFLINQPEQLDNHKQFKQKGKEHAAQKKGQFEFVEFVEPRHSKVLKNAEMLEKRAPVYVRTDSNVLGVFSSGSNVFFIAVLTVCCVASVVGIVGGTYYFNSFRKQRNEAFESLKSYSPAGPCRELSKKKNKSLTTSPITDHGDDTLAYKAQLHHYQQTKQKIIGDESNIAATHDDHSDKSDDEADDLEEHNFSVYECPGLAPTGDIEVQNPNFKHLP